MKTQREGFLQQRLIRLPGGIQEGFSKDPMSSQLYLTDIGHFPPVDIHRVVRKHPLDQQILICCIEGEGWCWLEGKKRTIKKDSYFVIPAGQAHAYGNTPGKSWTIYWIHFKGNQSKSMAEQLCDGRYGQSIPLIARRERLRLFHEIILDLENGVSPASCSLANARLWHLLGDMVYHHRFAADKGKSVVDQAILFMRERVEEAVSLEEIAAYVNLSATYFVRLFKKQMHQTPVDYFIRLKIQRACQYLDFTDMAVKDIAQQLGYKDSYYFSRVFKRIMGLSPLSYRTSHQH